MTKQSALVPLKSNLYTNVFLPELNMDSSTGQQVDRQRRHHHHHHHHHQEEEEGEQEQVE